jgi:glycosyltransferase involved in cell wall biosynthesis
VFYRLSGDRFAGIFPLEAQAGAAAGASGNGYKQQVLDLVRRFDVDVCILSHRPDFFLLPELSRHTATIVDWCDSLVLYYVREMRLLLSMGQLKQMCLDARHLLDALSDELFYSRYPDANIVVSSGDKQSLDRLNGKPHTNHVIYNGVTLPAAETEPQTKRSDRLIFTGTMSFPPNYKGAIWFIDHVMPLLLRSNPNIQLVVAGQDPMPQLVARASKHVIVTGTVPDIKAEITKSSLYVAPLFSGTGFRNKVVEAIACGVYVIGTPMALEFLDERFRSCLSVAENAGQFARLIREYLQAPAAYDDRLKEAMRLLREDYTWANRTKQLAGLCEKLIEQRGAVPASEKATIKAG